MKGVLTHRDQSAVIGLLNSEGLKVCRINTDKRMFEVVVVLLYQYKRAVGEDRAGLMEVRKEQRS